jgi:hypothetical protein
MSEKSWEFEYVPITDEQAQQIQWHIQLSKVASIAVTLHPCEDACEHLSCNIQREQ